MLSIITTFKNRPGQPQRLRKVYRSLRGLKNRPETILACQIASQREVGEIIGALSPQPDRVITFNPHVDSFWKSRLLNDAISKVLSENVFILDADCEVTDKNVPLHVEEKIEEGYHVIYLAMYPELNITTSLSPNGVGLQGFTKRFWKKVGGFDEDYVGYGREDADFCMKARDDGKPIMYLGGGITHIEHEREEIIHKDEWQKNQTIFLNKWGRKKL